MDSIVVVWSFCDNGSKNAVVIDKQLDMAVETSTQLVPLGYISLHVQLCITRSHIVYGSRMES